MRALILHSRYLAGRAPGKIRVLEDARQLLGALRPQADADALSACVVELESGR